MYVKVQNELTTRVLPARRSATCWEFLHGTGNVRVVFAYSRTAARPAGLGTWFYISSIIGKTAGTRRTKDRPGQFASGGESARRMRRSQKERWSGR